MGKVLDECLICADGFTWGVGDFGDGLVVDGDDLHDEVESADGGVIGEPGSDAECARDFVMPTVVDVEGAGEGEAIGEDEFFIEGVDSELDVVVEGFLGPDVWVAGIVAQACVCSSEVRGEGFEEGVHGDDVGEGDGEVAVEGIEPVGECVVLEGGEGNAGHSLICLEVLVGHGSDGGEVAKEGLIDVGGALELGEFGSF